MAIEQLSMAEKLGYEKNTKLLIIHADDGGLLHSVNGATYDFLKKQHISSASYMMPTPWIFDAVQQMEGCITCDIGVHLVLNSEWPHYRWGPITSKNKVKSLLDKHGMLLSSREAFVENAKTSHAVKEIKAQIDMALALGMNISHIDTHMGTIYTDPKLLSAYIQLAQEYQVIPMIMKWSEQLEQYLAERPIYDAEKIKKVLLQAEKNQQIMLDYLITDVGGSTLDERKTRYLKTIDNLQPGLTQIITHLSYPSPAFDSIIETRPVETRRYWDIEILSDNDVKKAIKRNSIKVISWGEVQKVTYGSSKNVN